MYEGKLVFAQLMDFLPLHTFRRCVSRYRGQYKVKRFSCYDQYLCMAFAQLAHRESVRDMSNCQIWCSGAESSGDLIDVCYFNSVFEFHSSDYLRQVRESA